MPQFDDNQGLATITNEDASLVVTTLLDVVNAGDGVTSLREAIAYANILPSDDTITFAPDLSGGLIRLGQDGTLFALFQFGTLTIDGDINDDGKADITISGDVGDNDVNVGTTQLTDIFATPAQALEDNRRIISGFDLTLDGLVLTGGYAVEGFGGAVSAFRVSLINSVVSGNYAGNSGGGVSAEGAIEESTFTTALIDAGDASVVSGSTIENNKSGRTGGGLAGQGWIITDSTVSGNVAVEEGGGIYDSDIATLINVTISGNSAGTDGGGVFAFGANLTNVTVSGNTALGNGGGVYLDDGSAELTNSILLGNSAESDGDVHALGSVLNGANIVGGQVFHGSTPAGATTAAGVFAATVDIGGGVLAGVLADNGGNVKTIALKDDAANPALDSANASAPVTDARGFARVDRADVANLNGNGADIGAFERQDEFAPGVNTAPVNTLPGALEIEANVPTAITGLAIADADAGSGSMTTTMSVAHGTLTVGAVGGGAAVAGSGSATVTLTGTLAAINTTLGGSNVLYQGAQDYFFSDTLTMTTNDQGNTGSGGPLADTDQVAIDLITYLIGTPENESYIALPGNERIDARTGDDTVTFDFALVDATITYRGNLIIIDGPNGSHTLVSGFERFEFTDGTVNTDDGSPLVDDLFYYSRNHDVWNAGVDADAHFAGFGWQEGRDPNAFFSTSFYLAANPDVDAAGTNPLDHWHDTGWQEGRAPSPRFDPAQYLDSNPDVAAAHVDPLAHYLAFGYEEGRLPNDLLALNGFDYVYYLANNPDVAAAGVDPFGHFMTVGWTEGRNPNALFDTSGYLATYTDVQAAGANPLEHYHESGWREGRDPSVDFDTSTYLTAYPDVAAANTDPLTHYLYFGILEERSTFADGVWG